MKPQTECEAVSAEDIFGLISMPFDLHNIGAVASRKANVQTMSSLCFPQGIFGEFYGKECQKLGIKPAHWHATSQDSTEMTGTSSVNYFEFGNLAVAVNLQARGKLQYQGNNICPYLSPDASREIIKNKWNSTWGKEQHTKLQSEVLNMLFSGVPSPGRTLDLTAHVLVQGAQLSWAALGLVTSMMCAPSPRARPLIQYLALPPHAGLLLSRARNSRTR